jgi:5-methylcytosine-specific restriction endonuclease McrA
VLRKVEHAAWSRRLTLLGWRHELAVGRTELGVSWSTRALRSLEAEQRTAPVPLVRAGERTYWRFEDVYYWEDEQLEAADVLALVRDRERRRQRKLERARMALALDEQPVQRRQPIPREVRLAVYERDGGRCVLCEATFDLQYDHVLPVARGGASTVENVQLLCAPCNRAKGDDV